MPRLLFKKTGNAVWISHLDLMRLFQRAFKRAGLPLTHSQGYNPRASVSIALPLSVGVDSVCELLDFELDGVEIPYSEIKDLLNVALVDGVAVLDVYDNGRKIRDLSLMQCRIDFYYDDAVPTDAVDKISALLAKSEVVVPKKTKNGMQDQNIVTMIRNAHIDITGEKSLAVCAVINCQNPALNPAQIPQAVAMYLPELKPAYYKCSRVELYDSSEKVFR